MTEEKMETEAPTKEAPGTTRLLLRGVVGLAIVLALLFVLAGRWDYWQGWIFTGACVALLAVSLVLFRGQGDLARERMRPGPGTKWWDWVFYAFYIPGSMAVLLLPPLDAGWEGGAGLLPWWVTAAAYAPFLLAVAGVTWAQRTNAFFSSTVRIQRERGHRVVRGGPYRFVRHPGYVAGLVLMPSMSLVLGSWWGLVPAAAVIPMIVVRTALEDRTLRRELEGYADYAASVRYRLFPGLW